MDETAKYPEGHFLGIWMAICCIVFTAIWMLIIIALGVPALIGVGPAMGVTIGLAVGMTIEHKQKEKGRIRPLTKSEKRIRGIAVVIGVIIGLIGFVLFLVGLL